MIFLILSKIEFKQEPCFLETKFNPNISHSIKVHNKNDNFYILKKKSKNLNLNDIESLFYHIQGEF